MITKFDSSYYGTADMENLGYAGTPINDRCYSKEQLAKALHKVVSYAKCMDERGYNTFWMAEHHFQPEGTELIPNLLMMAMHLCGVTKNLRIGCGFNIVPMWHPLRLAEDYAMADILTGGRVIFGVGRGYHTREVETFGSPLLDQDANREMFEKLSPSDQTLIIAAAKQGADATWRAGDDAEAKRLDLLRGEGMEIIDTINRQPFVDAVKPLDPEFEKLFGKDLLTVIRSTP